MTNLLNLTHTTIPYPGKLVAKLVGRRATGFERDLYAFPELPPDKAQFIEQQFFDYAYSSSTTRAAGMKGG